MRGSAAEPPWSCWAALGLSALLAIAIAPPGDAAAKTRTRTAQAANVPLPPPRPESIPSETPSRPPLPATAEIPSPPPRPDSAPAEPVPEPPMPAAAEIPPPPPRPPDLAAPSQTAEAKAARETTPAEDDACRQRLAELGVRFEPIDPISNGECGALRPLRVSSLMDGLEVAPPATLVCPLAEALARWAREVVGVEANRQLESQPTRIAIGTSYECRNQNRQTAGKLSEHAFANGVDVSGFEFKGRKAIQIGDQPGESPEAMFQAAVRTGACAYFTTVLGPGQPAHDTHLHLDLRGRGHGYRICQ